MRWRLVALVLLISLVPLAGLSWYVGSAVYWLEVHSAVGGLMNFVDAKQQGVIRFLGQNEKLAQQLAVLVESAEPTVVQTYFAAVVRTDVFRVEDHPFKKEIESGQRHIPTLRVYRAIDFVRAGTIEISSDPSRVGTPWRRDVDVSAGYSDAYLLDGQPVITFGAPAKGGTVYVHVDALMLTDIVNGEIGNLEGRSGTFYLAGVGKTFDYYIVNRDNVMLTQSRVYPNALLRQKGSEFPWKRTLEGTHDAACAGGVYLTDAGVKTGCREAMGFYPGPGGKQMVGASMPFYDSNWTIVVEQEASELLGPLLALRDRLWLVTLLTSLAVAAAAFLFTRTIAASLTKLTRAVAGLSEGNLDQDVTVKSNDEIGVMAARLVGLLAYFREITAVADRLAGGDLTVTVEARSERDALSHAFGRMVRHWQDLVGQVQDSAEGLARASQQLGETAGQTGQAVQQVTTAVQQVARGAQDQSIAAQESSHSVDQLLQAITQVARGTQEQARSVGTASTTAEQMAAGVEHVATKAQSVAAASQQTKASAEQGVRAVEETVAGMTEIQHVVSQAAGKVEELGKLGERIGAVVETIDDIAEQ
ncbi:MAG: HAMP domain-containing protein, partial [Chloroflexi bacterium]|nr:HAMP domain-containing protein [Chloroflexota bacterium]